MEVMEALKGRQSVKSYLPTPVEEEKLQKVLEAGRLAPSSYNSQCRKFIVVTHLRCEEGDPRQGRYPAHDRAGSGGSCAMRHA